ncbi:MAG: hypothetical protein AAF478_03615 [Pseudomonadota bacterium]
MQAKREQMAVCTQCFKPLYVGDVACHFYADETFCEEHAVTIKEAISHFEQLLKIGEIGQNEEKAERKLKDEIIKHRRLLMRHGDVKHFLEQIF